MSHVQEPDNIRFCVVEYQTKNLDNFKTDYLLDDGETPSQSS